MASASLDLYGLNFDFAVSRVLPALCAALHLWRRLEVRARGSLDKFMQHAHVHVCLCVSVRSIVVREVSVYDSFLTAQSAAKSWGTPRPLENQKKQRKTLEIETFLSCKRRGGSLVSGRKILKLRSQNTFFCKNRNMYCFQTPRGKNHFLCFKRPLHGRY